MCFFSLTCLASYFRFREEAVKRTYDPNGRIRNPSEMENQVYLKAKTKVCITCNIPLICDIVLNPVEYTLILIVSRTSPKSRQFFFDSRSDIFNVKWLSSEREKWGCNIFVRILKANDSGYARVSVWLSCMVYTQVAKRNMRVCMGKIEFET